LTTNQSVYQPGQPIQMTFTETNTSNQPVTVGVGPSIDGFDVTQNGKPVWESNAGVNPLFILVKTLQPGQSLTLNSTWNGVPSPGQPSTLSGGTFTVTNQLDPQGASATFQIEPSVSSSLTTDQSVYQAGAPIAMTFTETNMTSQPVSVTVDPTDFTVSANGSVVWQSNPDNSALPGTPETLQPGQSVTQTATWDGTQSFEGTNIDLWGSYVVSNPNAPGLTAAFQINDPLVSSISTNRPVYQTGQPVEITSYLTNTSDQPVTIVTGQGPGGGFEVSQNGTLVWTSVPSGIQPDSIVIGTQTIQPGQASTYTSTWDGVPSSAGATASPVTGSFVASLAGDSQGPTASFQIESSISYTMSVGQSSYEAGQPVPITFAETNTSSQPVTVIVKPPDFSVIDNFDNDVAWQSDPANASGPGQTETLQPGQSVTQTATWNGLASQGRFIFTSPVAATGFTVTNDNAPQGLSATFQIPFPLTSKLTTDQNSYVTGEPVQMTFIETNTSGFPIIVVPSGSFTVTNDVTNATVFTEGVDQNAPIVTLQPGQSLTQTATWNGAQPGNYDLNYQNADAGTFGSIQVTPAPSAPAPPVQNPQPVTETVTTSLQTHHNGHTVVMTLTLQNTSSQSVVISPNPSSDGFTVFSGSTKVWHSARSTRAIKARTLLAGESITLRAVWNGKPNQRGTKKPAGGLYTVEASEGGYSAGATIQIDR